MRDDGNLSRQANVQRIEADVLADYLKRWGIAPDSSDNSSHLLNIATTMCTRCRAYSERLGESESAFEERLRGALGVLRRIQVACNQFVRAKGIVSTIEEERIEKALQRLPDSKRENFSKHMIWYPVIMELEFQEGDKHPYALRVDVNALGEAIGEYLEREWMQDDTLELLMLDALMYSRVSDVGRKIKANWPGFSLFGLSLVGLLAKGRHDRSLLSSFWLTLARRVLNFTLFVAVPAAVAVYFYRRGQSTAAGIGLVLYSVSAISIAISRMARTFTSDSLIWHWRRLVLQYAAMVSIYSRIWEPAMSPRTLRDIMLASEGNGACWPMASYTLLEFMMQRKRVFKSPSSPSWIR